MAAMQPVLFLRIPLLRKPPHIVKMTTTCPSLPSARRWPSVPATHIVHLGVLHPPCCPSLQQRGVQASYMHRRRLSSMKAAPLQAEPEVASDSEEATATLPTWELHPPTHQEHDDTPCFSPPPPLGLDGLQPELPAGLTPLQLSGMRDRSRAVQSVQWYPGHIARAERQLKEQLKMVDLVLEVRDARIPVSTHHPQVAKWVGPKPRLLVINRQDQISEADRRAWADHYKSTGLRVFWTQGKQGDGVKALQHMLTRTSKEINAKRAKRGLQPRPVRACVIGFPNIGKSALINRLIGRKAVASAPKPGVTRALQWVRLPGQLDLLDAPGVIPAAFQDQVAAQRLAVCNDIGEAAYVDSLIAAAFVVRCKLLPSGPKLMEVLRQRYGVDPEVGTAEDFVVAVAEKMFHGEIEKAGARILKDYRNGFLGAFALELPPDIDEKRRNELETEAAKLKAKEERRDGGF